MLSGGERNRLLLARLFAQPSNLLVMDEPTNDLDAETLDLLEEMVADYAGTLLLVSHDRAFLDNVVTSTLVFEGDAQVNEYVGGYSDWLHQRKAGGAASRAAAAARAASSTQTNTPMSASAAAAAASPARMPPQSAAHAGSKARKLSYKDQRELEAMPEKIQLLEAEQTRLQTALSDPDLFRQSPGEATAALQRLQELDKELENAYSRWDALESLASA
jgi:ATP-binding cassette subfamily F protein uup